MNNTVPQVKTTEEVPLLTANVIFPFMLVTTLFALWGFANDVTNPLVAAFKDIFQISVAQSSLVQTAFYGGYATMAIPAALFIRRFSYKAGILVGLGLYAVGAFLFIPASVTMQFWLFLLALYVLTFGLAFLETTANPYILSMGAEKTATRRLNLAQSFNPIGSLVGMVVASQFILTNLERVGTLKKGIRELPPTIATLPAEVAGQVTGALQGLPVAEALSKVQGQELNIVRLPYIVIGFILLVMILIFAISKMPKSAAHDIHVHPIVTAKRLFQNKRYIEGVVAQAFYVGAQIMCWTYVIHYATINLGWPASKAQRYNIIAMVIFCSSRFICTYLLKYFSPGRLLMSLAIGGIVTTLGTIFIKGEIGLYCLIGTSACMSLMFPTIYGIALDGLGQDAKLGSAGLIFAIVGGALMPPLQGKIIDMKDFNLGFTVLTSVSASFVLPLICFVVIAIYGYRTYRAHHPPSEDVGLAAQA